MALGRRIVRSPGVPPETAPAAGRHSGADVDEGVTERVKAEFQEMRGFSPTVTQAARLFNLPHGECARLLDLLVRDQFLQRAPDGTYRLVA